MIKKNMKSAMLSVIMTAYAVLLIINAEAVTTDMKEAVLRCLNIIIPSLFAFMAVSEIIIRSGAYVYISKVFTPLAYIIAVPKELIFVFILSNCAGYPVGAVLISRLYDEGCIDKNSASRLLCTSYNAGPAFFCGAVGVNVFNSSRTGLIIFFSVILGNMIYASIFNRFFRIKCTDQEKKLRNSTDILNESVESSGKNILNICAVILFFQTFATLISCTGIDNLFSDTNRYSAAESFLEISNLTKLTNLPFYLLPVIASAGAFGGICVILQIKSIVKKRFAILPFILSRIIIGLISATVCLIIDSYFGVKYVNTSKDFMIMVNFNNFVPSVCLIMMIFIILFKKRLAISKKV